MNLFDELRWLLRRLARAPGFAASSVLMLALGIALGTMMVAVLHGVLGSLPYPDADRLLVLEAHSAERGVHGGGLTPAEALQLAQPDSPLQAFGYYDWNSLTLLDGGQAREISAIRVSAGFFPTIGMPPLHGRWLSDSDHDGDAAVVVLSFHEWQRSFGGDPAAIGRQIDSTDGRLRVVGVMPPGFAIPTDEAGAWRPLPAAAYPLDQPWTWHARFVSALARVDPSLAPAAVAQRLDAASDALAARIGLPRGDLQLRTRPLLDTVVGDLRGVLWTAFAIAVLVLLIACANVAIMIDARQIARRHEQAVVQALGASRRRLGGGLLLEVVALTAVAAGLGCLLAVLGIDALRELARDSLPRVDAIAVDGAVLAIAAGLSLLLPLVAATAGTLRPRADASEAIRSGGRGVVGGSRRRAFLPVLGIALSAASLVVGSALLFSLWRLQAVDPGLRHENVYALQMFHDGEIAHAEFARRLREQLLGLPAVEAVALGSSAPLASQIGSMAIDLKLPQRSEPEPWQVGLRRVTPEFAAVLRIPILHGRMFDAQDRPGAEKVAIVNRELARRLFGDGDPLGQQVELPLGNGPRIAYRIVGVSENFHNEGLRAAPGPELWVPFASDPGMAMSFLVASRQPLADPAALFADALRATDPREAASLVLSLGDSLDEQLAPARFLARTVGGLASASLLLAAFGIHAVAAQRQRQRVGEFGLRLAIGARPRALALDVLRASARSVALGLALGLTSGWAALRALQSQLFGLDGSLGVLVLGATVLCVAALLAALQPALRAARVDPMSALRHD